MIKTLAWVGVALVLAGCANKSERPEPTKLSKLDTGLDLAVRWQSNLGGEAADSLRLYPAMQSDRVYAAAGEWLVAWDLASGESLFSQELEAAVSGATSVAGNRVYWADAAGFVNAADTTTGEIDWRFSWGREMLVAPTPGSRGLLIRSTDNDLALLDFQGQLVWEREGIPAQLAYRGQARPLAVDGGFIVADDAGSLAAVLDTDGLDAWRRSLGATRDELIDLDADPVLAAEQIIAAGAQTGVSAISPQGGSVIWQSEVFSREPLSTDGTRVFATDPEGQVYALNASNGEILWRQPGLKFRFPSGPAVTPAGVYVADSLGVVHLLDPANGQFVARATTALTGTVSLSAFEQDVIAMDNSGRLVVVGLDN